MEIGNLLPTSLEISAARSIDSGRAHPTEHDISLPEMIASVTGSPSSELKSAIQSKDVTAFAKAYADLTDACNACHQALNHGVVEIASTEPYIRVRSEHRRAAELTDRDAGDSRLPRHSER